MFLEAQSTQDLGGSQGRTHSGCGEKGKASGEKGVGDSHVIPQGPRRRDLEGIWAASSSLQSRSVLARAVATHPRWLFEMNPTKLYIGFLSITPVTYPCSVLRCGELTFAVTSHPILNTSGLLSSGVELGVSDLQDSSLGCPSGPRSMTGTGWEGAGWKHEAPTFTPASTAHRQASRSCS